MGTDVLCEDQNIEYHLVTLFEKLESVRRENGGTTRPVLRLSMHAEVRTLEFWRSIISECLASFFYVFIVCGAAASGENNPHNVVLATALAAGFAMTMLTHCFSHISGAHVNPAVSVAMMATRHISPVRALMFVSAQCGGGIAGAAALYGISIPGYQTSMNTSVIQVPLHLTAWERFGVEFILTFVVVFSYFVCTSTYRKWLGNSSFSIGSAYLACTLVSMPSLNPARSLGPAFVMNKWDSHWVFWFGPLLGGIASGMVYEFIFNPKRHLGHPNESIDGDSSSIHSDEDTYDELDKPPGRKFQGTSTVFRAAAGGVKLSSTNAPQGYCPSLTSASLYSAPASCKVERVESLYGGTKSLYTKSPPLTRANLNRSQSVYSKVVGGLPRAGPLLPAHSMYPMHIEQVNSQNVHNQKQMLYGRPKDRRPDSVYGVTQRRQESQDSTYGSYQSNRVVHDPAKKNYVGTVSNFEGNIPKATNYSNEGSFETNGMKSTTYDGGKRNYESSNNFDGNAGNYDDVEKVSRFEGNPSKVGPYEASKKNYMESYEGNSAITKPLNYVGDGGNFETNRNGDALTGGNFHGNIPPKGNFEAVKNYSGNGPNVNQENNLSTTNGHATKSINHPPFDNNMHGKHPSHFLPVGNPPGSYGKYPMQNQNPRLIINPSSAITSYHHTSRHSPSPQY